MAVATMMERAEAAIKDRRLTTTNRSEETCMWLALAISPGRVKWAPYELHARCLSLWAAPSLSSPPSDKILTASSISATVAVLLSRRRAHAAADHGLCVVNLVAVQAQ